MNTHHGKIESEIASAEENRYETEFASPSCSRVRSPRAKSRGTAKAPTPINTSVAAYRKIADRPVRRVSTSTHRPPAHDPSASPSMNTEITTEMTGVMIPNDAKASRTQTT
jgi:hypothetical protein